MLKRPPVSSDHTQREAQAKHLRAALVVGGFGYLVDSVQMFALPDAKLLEMVKIALLLVVTVSEIGFALWLLFRGPRQTRSRDVAA